MLQLNNYWSVFSPQHQFQEEGKLLNEKELIQLHLFSVEAHLRNNTPTNLNAAQKSKRLQLLDELKAYAANGVFPINSYHSKRTPYFIDNYGTACAVGQLIIQSGHSSLAHKVAQEDNYAYIENMSYPAIDKWADVHGFSELELRWIQPSYTPFCELGTVKDPLCKGQNGCINLNYQADALIPPFKEKFEFNNGEGWKLDSNGTYMDFQGARVGDHRITVTDSMNTEKIYTVTINNAPEKTIDTLVTPPSSANHCDGNIQLTFNKGEKPFELTLMNQSINYFSQNVNGYFDSLCVGTYTIVIYDSNYCQHTKGITINHSTSLPEHDVRKLAEVFPNPFSNQLHIRSNGLRSYEYKLYTLTGKLIKEGDLKTLKINTESLQEGIFFIELSNGINRFSQKIIKSN